MAKPKTQAQTPGPNPATGGGTQNASAKGVPPKTEAPKAEVKTEIKPLTCAEIYKTGKHAPKK